MYSWGGDTSAWRGPSSYDFDSARKAHIDSLASAAAKKGPRTYAPKSAPDSKLVNAKGKTLESTSENPVLFAIDVTGSMANWPAEIFDRLPLFYQTLSQYRPDLEVSFAAVGDATCDQHPLQVNAFGKGLALEDHVKALFGEGGGGGQMTESYELYGWLADNKVVTPNAKKPFLFIVGDEKPYDRVEPAQVQHYIGEKLNDPVPSKDVWKSLTEKYSLFFLQKPYDGSWSSNNTKDITETWARAIGKQRIVQLPSSDRVVDIAMGIVAKSWGQYGDFDKNMAARQPDDVRMSVHASLRHVPDGAGGSVTKHGMLGSPTVPLSKRLKP